MLRCIFILFFLIFITNSKADYKEGIIENLKNTRNLNFNFEQNINGNTIYVRAEGQVDPMILSSILGLE